LVLEVAEES